MKNVLLKKIVSIVSKCTSIPKNQINIKMRMESNYNWDSVSNMKIILELEKNFRKIKTSEFYQLNSIDKIVKKLKKK